jgi:hypothetical protein
MSTLTFCVEINAQDFNNPESVFLESQGHQLKTKHIMAWMLYNIQQGNLTAEPSEAEMESIMMHIAEQFMIEPRQTLETINATSLVASVEGLTGGNTNSKAEQFDSNQKVDSYRSFSMADIWDKLSPGNKFEFDSARANQIKQVLSGSRITQRNNAYSAPSYGGSVGVYSESSLTIHFCSDDTFTWNNSAGVSAGSDNVSAYDYGSDQVTGNWDVATAGTYTFITLYSQHPDMLALGTNGLAPMMVLSIGSDYVSISNADVAGGEDLYRLTSGGANCH